MNSTITITRSSSSSLAHHFIGANASVHASPLLHRSLTLPFLLPSVQARHASYGQAKAMRKSSGARQDPSSEVSRQLRGMDRAQFEDEFGLLPGTFVRPKWSNLPSVFSDRAGLFRLLYQSVRSSIQDLAMLINYYKAEGTKKPMRLRHRKSAALELHARMNQALAAGDLRTLEKTCCTGLLEQASSIIARRKPGRPVPKWTLEKYIKFPRNLDFGGARVLSDRAAMIAKNPEIGYRQVVVRIQSKQTVTKPPSPLRSQMANGQRGVPSVATSEKKSRDCTEHVVLQKLVFKGVEDKDWKIWGLVEETTLQKLKSDPLFDPNSSLADTLRSMGGR